MVSFCFKGINFIILKIFWINKDVVVSSSKGTSIELQLFQKSLLLLLGVIIILVREFPDWFWSCVGDSLTSECRTFLTKQDWK